MVKAIFFADDLSYKWKCSIPRGTRSFPDFILIFKLQTSNFERYRIGASKLFTG